MEKQIEGLVRSFRVAAKSAGLHVDGHVAYLFCADTLETLARANSEKLNRSASTNSGYTAALQNVITAIAAKNGIGLKVVNDIVDEVQRLNAEEPHSA